MLLGGKSSLSVVLQRFLPAFDRGQADVQKLGDFREGDLLSKKTCGDATADFQLRRSAFGSHPNYYGDSTKSGSFTANGELTTAESHAS